MPGPMSDAYDPEFSTRANADRIADAIQDVVDRIDSMLGPQLHDILDVVDGKGEWPMKQFEVRLSERELRIIRFALNRARETI